MLTDRLFQSVREGCGMIACYCQVSSRSQKTDSQKAELTRWLASQGLDLTAVQWFEDVERGQSLRRPAFARLQRAIGAGTITTVVVWKLDRLARLQQDGINLLAAWCAQNVRVVAVTQQIDRRVCCLGSRRSSGNIGGNGKRRGSPWRKPAGSITVVGRGPPKPSPNALRH